MVHAGVQIAVKRLAAALMLLAAPAAHGAGVTGADMLKARMGVRAVALGEAYSALGDDLGSALYNPAGLSQLKGPAASFLHWNSVASVSYEQFAYAQPFKFGTLGLGVGLRNQPDINNRLATDAPVSAFDVMLALSYAQKLSYYSDSLSERLREASLGVNLKYLRSHLGRFDADAYAADLGARLPLEEGLSAGLSLLNLGPPMKFISSADPLPAIAMGGLAKKFDWGNPSVTNLSVDLEYPLVEGNIRLHFGAEQWLGKGLALRGGYILEPEGSLSGATGGLAVKLDQQDLMFGFDYAFRPFYYQGFSSFEAQHLFSMNLGF